MYLCTCILVKYVIIFIVSFFKEKNYLFVESTNIFGHEFLMMFRIQCISSISFIIY